MARATESDAQGLALAFEEALLSKVCHSVAQTLNPRLARGYY